MLLTYSVRSFAMSEIPALFSQRPIVERHKKAAMYHPFVEGLAMTLVDVPVTFATMVLYTIILYFLVKLQQTAGQFLLSSRVTSFGHIPDYFTLLIASFS
jgi:ABC-type multidrug transport system permease subunit